MTKFEDLIDHIESCSCVPMEGGTYKECIFYQNLISFDMAGVIIEDPVDELACFNTFYELSIEPMQGMEEAYKKYIEFRKSIEGLG